MGSNELTEEQRLALILEATRSATWQWNVSTGETRFNARWAGIIGYTLEELGPASFETWLAYSHPGDLASLEPVLRAHHAGLTPDYEGEVRMKHKDGHWVWVLTCGRVMTWTEDGNPEWMMGTHVDLTARKKQEEELRKSESFLHRTGAVAGVGGWELDIATGKVYLSDEVCRIHGVPAGSEADAEGCLDFYTDETRELLRESLAGLIETGEPIDIELPRKSVGGAPIVVRVVATREADEAGRPVKLVGASQDITLAVAQRHAVERAKERLALAADSGNIAIWEFDRATRQFSLDAVGCRAYGLPGDRATLRLEQWLECIHPDDRERTIDAGAAAMNGAQMDNEFRVIWADGSVHHLHVTARATRDANGRAIGLLGANWDVTRLRELSTELAEQHNTTLVTLKEMSHRAKHDALTGLVNRAELESRLRRTLAEAKDGGGEHALMCIDLDQFKLVNDACGHSVGDRLLQQVSKLLQESVRASDTVARTGGDEFAILLEHCPIDQAQRIAQKICDRMEVFRFVHEDRRFRVGTSIGLAGIDDRWPNAEALMQAADTSCFAAKEAGRNRVHMWLDTDLALRARGVETKWATRLEEALDANRFVLFAQRIAPITEARHEGLHAEVLVRMREDDGTLVPPGAFLPAAERFHLASRIDRWVLRHAIDALSRLRDLSVVEMLAVNLSGQSIGDRSFHAIAIQLLNDAGPQVCRRICLEITETTAITNLDDAAIFVREVRKLGIRVALDDFGAGASSFGYLKSLAVDLIKIDGQFVKDLLEDPLDDTAVRCFVDVARVVGVKTVAEMVERPDVYERLAEIGVDYAQGYLVHRPEPLNLVLGEQVVANLTLCQRESARDAMRENNGAAAAPPHAFGAAAVSMPTNTT